MNRISRAIIASILITSPVLAEEDWIPIWPNLSAESSDEQVENRDVDQNAKGLNRSISNVTVPGLSLHLPKLDSSKSAAVIVLPGGGFSRIVVNKEGFDTAERLNAEGLAAIVLKYRTWIASPEDMQEMMVYYRASPDERAKMTRPNPAARREAMHMAFMDVQKAVRVVRAHASEWNIDPTKIGVMGFSAGGQYAAAVSMDHDDGDSTSHDAIQRVSCRPDFAALVYTAIDDERATTEAIATMPPTFIVHAEDDKLVPVTLTALKLHSAMRKQNLSAELHIYAKGGHGFGLGVQGGAVSGWPSAFLRWLDDINVIE